MYTYTIGLGSIFLENILSTFSLFHNWKLRSYKLRLPRTEVEEVEKLRENWQEVIDLAEVCRVKLLKERRGAFEQELDKQVKVGWRSINQRVLTSWELLLIGQKEHSGIYRSNQIGCNNSCL